MNTDKKPHIQNTINGLIGQANLEHARGRSNEALSLLNEAVRQAPRDAEVYNQIACVYADLKRTIESFEYRLLAAHISSKTTAANWSEVGDLALTVGRMEQAIECYDKAIRKDPSSWIYYDKRINLLEAMCLNSNAMKLRLQAAKHIDCKASQISFDFIKNLIKQVAEYYISQNDEDKAMDALKIFVLRSRQFGRSAVAQHLTLLGAWMMRGLYEDCVKSILAIEPGIRGLTADGEPAYTINFTNNDFIIEPFPADELQSWAVDESFGTQFLARLIVNLIRCGLKHLAPTLIDELLERPVQPGEENCFLEVGRAYQLINCIVLGTKYMEVLLQVPTFQNNPDAWFLFGIFEETKGDKEVAKQAYQRVLQIQPAYVDARINLSTILQSLNQSDEALEILMDYDLASCSSLPDERLLLRQAEVLFMRKRTAEYAKCVRLILLPYFYEINQQMQNDVRYRASKNGGINFTLKRKAFDATRGSPLDKMVKRLGATANGGVERNPIDQLTGDQLHDFAFHLSEYLYNRGEIQEFLHVVCYAFLHNKINNTRPTTFKNLLFFASIKACNYALAFEFLRFHYLNLMSQAIDKPVEGEDGVVARAAGSQSREEHNYTLFCRTFNAMNYVFCHRQDVCYHRFVMRALSKTPQNYPLHMISGNNSLITGSYRHALGEYFRVWLSNRKDPLVCLLIALTFTHMSCKKDITSRHMVAARGIAFMKRYQKLRGECQEVDYNLGRMFHQLGMTVNAIFFYERVLHEKPTPNVYEVFRPAADGDSHDEGDEDGEEPEGTFRPALRYDMKRLAAHNLALIYETSGNHMLARQILEDYCTI